jgi:hypothetical protein
LRHGEDQGEQQDKPQELGLTSHQTTSRIHRVHGCDDEMLLDGISHRMRGPET